MTANAECGTCLDYKEILGIAENGTMRKAPCPDCVVLDQLVICTTCAGTGIADNLVPSDSLDLWDPCPDCGPW
jgi:hypothetical protein